MTTTDTTTHASGQVLDLLPATIRLWARANDLDVAPKGKIPDSVVDAYRKAHGHAPAPRPKPTSPVQAIATPGTPRPADTARHDARKEHAEVERLQAEVTSHRVQNEAHEAARAAWSKERSELRDRLAAAEERADLPCPGTHCGQEAVCPADTPPTVVSTLSGPLPDELVDLNDAWHQLFAKASDVATPAGHTLAELAAPALVREASDRIHDLIRLLDGDTAR